jgi:ABC-type nitrate/sulfonate/bicarbonate transport system substrate-binding protein
LEEGYYQQAGLLVTLNPGGLDFPSVQTVVAGQDQIGFANGPDLVIRARAAGAPLRIVAVVHQRSSHGFMVRTKSGIRTPKDWEGKRVGVKFASPTYLLYQVILKKEGVDRSKIEEVPLKYGLQPFLEGQIDVYPGAFTNEAISLEMMGTDLSRMDPVDYGINSFGNVMFTTERMIKEHPDIVRRFVQATLRGWEWCLRCENHEQAVKYLQRYSEHLSSGKELAALRLNIDLVAPKELGGNPVGWIDTKKLQAIVGYMREFGVLEKNIGVDDLVDSQFLRNAKSRGD